MPRQILPGTTYLLTRRCSRREHLLAPRAETSAIFLYVLAVAARRYGVLVHTVCVMSNHVHLVLTDPGARLPAFAQYLWSLVARAVNASSGRFEDFWARGSYSAVALATPDDVVAKAAYVLANPVAAGLVRRSNEWPGVVTSPAEIGSRIVVKRPPGFFRPNGPMPESETLELTAPPGFASRDEFVTRLEEAVSALEEQAASDGRKFLGREGVLRQSRSARSTSWEPRRELRPVVAARDLDLRIAMLRQVREFRQSYRAAWKALRAGVRDALFPAGTYLLRIMHGVRCAVPA